MAHRPRRRYPHVRICRHTRPTRPRGAMPVHSETLEITGHVIDSMLFTRILDQVREALCDYEIVEFRVGRTPADPSYARLVVKAERPGQLEHLVGSLMGLGMTRVEAGEATLVPAEMDGVLPDGFYSSTNLETEVRVGGVWYEVENPEMDCAIVVADGHARTMPMSDVRQGDPVVVGSLGIRVQPRDRGRAGEVFEFMSSQASSEKPQGLIVRKVADRGSTQATGVVTDVGLFLGALADELVP